jgi:hypothetical protein
MLIFHSTATFQGDPLQFSAYREEAVDAIVSALENSSHNRKLQEQCAKALLLLAGRFSSSGESTSEATLLRCAGLDDTVIGDSFRIVEAYNVENLVLVCHCVGFPCQYMKYAFTRISHVVHT